jgi:hypothetical protein
LFFLFLAITCPLSAQKTQDLSVLAIPDSLAAGAHSVVRYWDQHFSVTASDEAVLENQYAITILNDKGASWATAYVQESEFLELKSMKGWLYDAQGLLLRESEKADVGNTRSYDPGFDKTRDRFLRMEHVAYPYTVVFQLRSKIKGFFRVPEFTVQRLGQSVVQSSYTFSAPSDYQFLWKYTGKQQETQPKTEKNGDQTTHIWAFKSLSAVPAEPYHPYFKGIVSELAIAPKAVEIDGYKGNFSSWKEAGRFFYELNKGRDELSEDMQRTVRQLVAGKANNREKVAAIYRYLQQNHRYVSIQIGIGGWQTFDAAFVEKKKYGDCKALSNYAKAMLKVAGIEAHLAAIYASYEGYFPWDDTLPNLVANHMILYIPGEDMWLECTSDDLPPGYLSGFTSDRPALVLTPEGGVVRKTPALTAATDIRHRRTDIRLLDDGHADVRQTTLALHGEQDGLRNLCRAPREKQEKQLFSDAAYTLSKVHALKLEASTEQPEVSVQAHFDINNYGTRSGKRIFVPLTKINPFEQRLPEDKERLLDIRFPVYYTYHDTISLQLPEGYTVESAPPEKQLQSEFGSFSLKIAPSEGMVQAFRAIVLHPVSAPAARYQELRQFYQDLAKADAAQVVLVRR